MVPLSAVQAVLIRIALHTIILTRPTRPIRQYIKSLIARITPSAAAALCTVLNARVATAPHKLVPLCAPVAIIIVRAGIACAVAGQALGSSISRAAAVQIVSLVAIIAAISASAIIASSDAGQAETCGAIVKVPLKALIACRCRTDRAVVISAGSALCPVEVESKIAMVAVSRVRIAVVAVVDAAQTGALTAQIVPELALSARISSGARVAAQGTQAALATGTEIEGVLAVRAELVALAIPAEKRAAQTLALGALEESVEAREAVAVFVALCALRGALHTVPEDVGGVAVVAFDATSTIIAPFTMGNAEFANSSI